MTFQNPDINLSEAEAHQLDQELLTRIWSEERAAEARAGGRAITRKLGKRITVLRRIERGEISAEQGWTYQIDPMGGWTSYAVSLSRGEDMTKHFPQSFVRLDQAEAMVEWPIYRAAIARQVEEAAFVEGYARGSEAERLNAAFRSQVATALPVSSNIQSNDKLTRVMAAVEASALTSKRAIPNVAAALVAQVDPTEGSVAGALYMSGSKGGKAAALAAAPAILAALQD